MKKQENPKCDPCEKMFEENVHGMVKEVEGYTRQEHQKKEKEMEQAFADKSAGHTTVRKK